MSERCLGRRGTGRKVKCERETKVGREGRREREGDITGAKPLNL